MVEFYEPLEQQPAWSTPLVCLYYDFSCECGNTLRAEAFPYREFVTCQRCQTKYNLYLCVYKVGERSKR